MKALIASGALSLALAAVQPALAADAKPARSCFWTRDIGNHSFGGPSTIYLKVGLKDVYQVETNSNCTASHLRGDPLILDPAPITGQVCDPIDLDLKIGFTGGGPPSPCIVKSIKKLTPAEASAIPKKMRP